jgi:protein-tyrosine kinase
MFESLRRADAARKGKLARPAPAPEPEEPTFDPPTIVEPTVPGVGQLDGFPEGFLRELGNLKNSLESALGKTGKRTIVFASSIRGEGTTTVVSSLAKLLSLQVTAKSGVLLIEMNAHRPSLQRKLGLRSAAGATHFMEGRKTLDAVVQRSPQGSFDVIHVGENDPVIVQLYLDRMFPLLLRSALQRYDTVLIDAPPIVSSPETPPMTGFADGVVLVVHCGKTKREIAQRSMTMVGQFDARVLGVVLNRKKYYIPDFIYQRI